MYNILHKYKPYLLLLLKLIIVFGAFYFIYQKLNDNQLLSFPQLKEQLSVLISNNTWLLLILLLLTDVNWLLEIFKWKTLVSIEEKISFLSAYEQCLASLTVSIITPNRIGEYGAKALFFKKDKRKKIMLLNLVGNLSQLFVTVFLGIIGMFFFIRNFNFSIPKLNFQNIIILLIIIIVIFIFRKSLQLQKISLYFKNIPLLIFIKTLSFSFLRYVVFSHQFYFLTAMFGIETDYFTVMNLLFCMYFMASIIPSLSIFDWVIKGSIAVWLFSFVEVNELKIVTITTIMWLLNFAIPAILGSIFVLNFKLIKKV
ncbi:lysylphosphatidylglycerol synthase-like protein [Lutibacter oceani]|uniref:Lysylphosphatidylglycerol synthase-like protein n=1 Tax=Lutibacter oceani TaxID=1853311 RepID=A0A3D9RLG7_9FLAO|nr:lysylphosphatidylglycerol synthase-like protein [Lutibacter oceani]